MLEMVLEMVRDRLMTEGTSSSSEYGEAERLSVRRRGEGEEYLMVELFLIAVRLVVVLQTGGFLRPRLILRAGSTGFANKATAFGGRCAAASLSRFVMRGFASLFRADCRCFCFPIKCSSHGQAVQPAGNAEMSGEQMGCNQHIRTTTWHLQRRTSFASITQSPSWIPEAND